MATVVNKITAKVLYSVNTPDYPERDYLINPDLTAVKDIENIYWKVSLDNVVQKTAIEKKAVDDSMKAEREKGFPCYLGNPNNCVYSPPL